MTPDALGSPAQPHVLVTGATGYIGGRLVPVLESAGVRLRCLARQPAALASRVSPTTEIVAGDLLDPASLDRALAGIDRSEERFSRNAETDLYRASRMPSSA